MLNFRAIRPTITAYHVVKNLIIIASTNAVPISIFWSDNNPAKLPSVTPNPPGIIVTAPKIIDAEYVAAKAKYWITSIPKPNKIKYTANASIKR